jgi:transposase InsO family protein
MRPITTRYYWLTPPWYQGYFMLFIDDCTRYVYAYMLPLKSDAFEAYRSFENLHARDYGGVGTLRTDNGGEYTSAAFKAHLTENGNSRREPLRTRLNRTVCPSE